MKVRIAVGVWLVLLLGLALPTAAQAPLQFVNPQMDECAQVGNGAPVPGWSGGAICEYSMAVYPTGWFARFPSTETKMCQDIPGMGNVVVDLLCRGLPNSLTVTFKVLQDGVEVKSKNAWCGMYPTDRQRHSLGVFRNPRICLELQRVGGVVYEDHTSLWVSSIELVDFEPYPTLEGEEIEVLTAPLGGLCTRGRADCWADMPLEMYVNGLHAGTCTGAPLFTPRGLYSDTVTLFNGTGAPVAYNLSTTCEQFAAQTILPPTPTPVLLHPVTNTAFLPSNRWGLDFTFKQGRLPWLDFATETVQLVNTGNLLYIVSGILVATMVLGWAIDKVKNPKPW